MSFAGVFLCHTTGAEANTLCRGWAEVHEGNMSVRLAMFKVKWTEENNKPTKIPLYKSGWEAMKAGLRGVARPSIKARIAIEKITRRRQKKNHMKNLITQHSESKTER